MKVAIIGSGNVATVMGRLIVQQGHEVIQVISRNPEHAIRLTDELGGVATGLDGKADTTANIFIIAISDYALIDAVPKMDFGDKLVVHTAGSVSKDLLQGLSQHYGVLYPLQSLSRNMVQLPEIPLLVDGNSEAIISYLEDFARSLTPVVQRVNDENRLKLHAAAVVVSNFTNHLYALAESFCQHEQVDFDMLKPLILETAIRIRHTSPAQLQTGPAIRKDVQTLDKHLRLLQEYPQLKNLYLKLSESIMEESGKDSALF